MRFSSEAIWGRRAIYVVPASEYIDWAGEILTQGQDSYSLRILAGLETSISTYDAEQYFYDSIEELGLATPNSKLAISAYASEIAQKIVDGQCHPQEGLNMLYSICVATEYNQDYIIWLMLDDELDSLRAGETAYTFPGITLENFDQLVKQEAEKFIVQMRQK